MGCVAFPFNPFWTLARLAAALWLLALIACVGCSGNPFVGAQGDAFSQQQQQQQALVSQLQQRATELDINNRELHTQLAQMQQQSQIHRDELVLTKKQLTETAMQLRDIQLAKQESEQKLQGLQASVRQRGGATLTANNSLKNTLKVVDVPGMDVRFDGDVIRIELPADQVFQPHTLQLQPTAYNALDQAAAVLAQNYSRQRISIEAHTDTSPPDAASGVANNHQLTAYQAVAVFESLTQRNRMPSQQLATIGQGSNRPIVSNATPEGAMKNRRIEFVVHPQTVDGQ